MTAAQNFAAMIHDVADPEMRQWLIDARARKLANARVQRLKKTWRDNPQLSASLSLADKLAALASAKAGT